VGYDSQTFNDTECGYDIHDCKLLAVIRGLLTWCHLLIGSPHKVRVLTDHLNLKYYHHPQKISRWVAHYLPKMAEFDFELVYKPGPSNKADHLSRCPDHNDGSLDNQDITVLPSHLFIHVSMVSDIEQLILDAQTMNPELLQSWATHFNLSKSASAWYHSSALVVMEDNELRREVLSLYHDHCLAGHPGILKTLELLTRDYWWPTVKDFMTSYIKGCATCQSNKVNTMRPKAPPFLIMPVAKATPFETVAMDLITDLPLSNSFDSIFTITDHDSTKAAIFIPCNKTIDALNATQLYMKHMFPYYGTPRKIISDQDPHFTAELAKELCHLLDMKQNISTTYHLSREHGLGDHADGAEVVFLFLSLSPSSRLVHYCLDSCGVSSYFLATCAPNTTEDCHYLLLWTATTYSFTSCGMAWDGLGLHIQLCPLR
jgi:Integrase zinc binding domain/RNase H-like domain found in reverse transcriptase